MAERIGIAIFAALITLIGVRECQHAQDKSTYRKEIAQCEKDLNNVLTAAQRTDTIYDTIFEVFYIPKPYPVTSIDTVHDTITGTFGDIMTTYADSVPSRDITLFYVLKTSGTLKDLQLSYRLRQQQIVSERIVYKDKEIEVRQRFHLWGGLAFGQDASQATFAATYDRVGLMYTHDITHSRPMVGVVFKFR